MPGKLVAVFVFGSVGRAQHDNLSDLDVLAVVEDGKGKVSHLVVANYVPKNLKGLKLSISWYGKNRLKEMFENGELFAWHLYRETIPLFDPEHFLNSLGAPSSYSEAVTDVLSFQKILTEIPNQVLKHHSNSVYEAGLIYVCLRNISMAASSVLCEFPDFSRYSPFNLSGFLPCPISIREFKILMDCRMASQRGSNPPQCMNSDFVLDIFRRIEPWIANLVSKLQKEAVDGRQYSAH